jgi:hypothetical protein
LDAQVSPRSTGGAGLVSSGGKWSCGRCDCTGPFSSGRAASGRTGAIVFRHSFDPDTNPTDRHPSSRPLRACRACRATCGSRSRERRGRSASTSWSSLTMSRWRSVSEGALVLRLTYCRPGMLSEVQARLCFLQQIGRDHFTNKALHDDEWLHERIGKPEPETSRLSHLSQNSTTLRV